MCFVVDDGDDCWSDDVDGVEVERFSVKGNGGSRLSTMVLKLSLAILADGGIGIGGMRYPELLVTCFVVGAHPSVKLSIGLRSPVSCSLVGKDIGYVSGSCFRLRGGF